MLRRVWIPLLIVVVVVAGGFTVSRLRTVFGSEDRPAYSDTELVQQEAFDPKELVYEVFGPAGTTANVSYFDENSEPVYVEGVSLPWSSSFGIDAASVVGNLIAQGTGNSIGCRIIVDGEVRAERTSQGVNAFTYCLLKAA
ncbi:MmpS family transport accessory protein [Mycolicibacterium celeriflavum]|uniref:MmpS family transport accessory protein n=1 Tax=Mycolicibacterium celeriflavum TaxID=1249101 RepID=UPI000E75C26E|nr:MmpS family transport accessory protein [Mycolicibacterium celeriflavum]